MSKRKKKPSKESIDKIARAQHRNNFIKKIQYICEIVTSDKNVFKLIPQSDLNTMYDLRLNSPKIVPAKGHNIEKYVLNEAVILIPGVLKRNKIPITEEGHEIALSDYFTVFITLVFYITTIKEDSFPNAKELIDKLIKISKYDESFIKAKERLHHIIQTFGYIKSEMGKQIYWLNDAIAEPTEDNSSVQNRIEIYTHKPEQKQVTIENNTRPAFRACWGFANRENPEYIFIKPEDLGVSGPFASIPLEVYIQHHALQRLSERIDGLNIGLLGLNLHVALKEAKAIRYKENILIEFTVFQTKAGYLRVDIVDGIIVVRTFLFITNNGTPEGDKLNEICGLGKLDKNYLAIDKLSTFISSDFGSNKEIKQIFHKADCDCLFELYDKLKDISTKKSEQPTDELMAKFLGLNN